VEDVPVDQEFLDLLAKNRATYAPTLVVGRNATRASVSIGLGVRLPVDDPGGCVDSNTVAKVANIEPLRTLMSEERRAPEASFRRLEGAGARGMVMAENLRRVHAAGVTIATATDAGNPLTLHGPSIYAEMEAMQAAGLPASDILVMSTRNGAMAMGRLKDFGTLEAGKLADLLVLVEDPRVDVKAFRSRLQVMKGGRLHQQTALRQR
jgi:imidazolonepropionase-like amidohydrolase